MILLWVLNFGRKDTPVLMANNFNNTNQSRFKISNTKSLAVAASMPIVAVPIQDVQLLDYAVAHETVNSTYGLTASVDDDIYLGLLDKDPYTSDQQRERDEYEINDTDWNEVVFEEVKGNSTAKLALHNDWIDQKGYQVGAVVEMNLPEQGISGPFRITSIKHIIPQKKPVDEDESDDYSYKPITGLFIHKSSDVWNIKFDNGEKLGVTHNHPIYSTTIGGWQFAGMLSIGEEILTKNGNAKVISKDRDRVQEVYNLEVKDYHNFLVNESGVVVHNTGLCMDIMFDFYKQMFKNADDVTHILRGKVKNGYAGGAHHKAAFDTGSARIRPGSSTSPRNQHGVYEAHIDVKDLDGNFVQKTEASTFFPDDWSEMQSMENILHAWENYEKVPGTTNVYRGLSIDGNIEIHMYLRPDGSIISAFPIL